MLFGLFRRKTRTAEHEVYCAIVAQARQPEFYTSFGVPDTLDGRFDMIVAHAVLLFSRLRGQDKETSEFSQYVFDLFFSDLDATLREQGVADQRVPKKIKTMGEAFYGRADVYVPALEQGDALALCEAISRNIFPDEDAPAGARGLADYMLAAHAALKDQDLKAILSAQIRFPDAADFAPGPGALSPKNTETN
ncbi:ubiquinol-cytochrome C chaperone family protein [Roseibium suaedae]|uniref:Cytochrome b pre-mRNA-processing protein 3 n=1 Tax=Roseibium suaedae TaxID=735517 RepID=A0A1M7CYG9_9HYPH|nr:ubiquinol-cytochrome C chaperone family protein [Roseibium suaedae]SHL71919.1 cytochrome b pre-mRNA-processing protein 3 [Roseibium suaedae]